MKCIVVFLAVLIFTPFAYAKTTVCREISMGGATEGGAFLDSEGNIARIEIESDENKKITKMKIERTAYEGATPIKASFDRINSMIELKQVEVCAPNVDPCGMWGIREYQQIVITGVGGSKISLSLYDHSYAGTPGSTMNYQIVGQKEIATDALGTSVLCPTE